MSIPCEQQATEALRHRLRVFLVLFGVLAIQLGWTAYGWTDGATSFGWGSRVSFRNLSGSAQRGLYVGNEAGTWTTVTLGPRWGDPKSNLLVSSTWRKCGLTFSDFGPGSVRYVGLNSLWTLLPNALLASVAGVRWQLLRLRIRRADPTRDRGFAIEAR